MIDPEFPLATVEYLSLLREERRYDEIITRGRKLLNGERSVPARLRARAEALVAYAKGKPREAVRLFHSILQRWPYDTEPTP